MVDVIALTEFLYCLNDKNCPVLSFAFMYVFPSFSLAYFIIGLQVVE
jgi:hypothetical protein